MAPELIAIVLFMVVGTAMTLAFYFRFRTRREVQESVRMAIDKGQELTPELLRSLGEAREPKTADLRRGSISISVGLALIVFALAAGQEDLSRPLMAVSSFPFLLGLAYLGLWRFGHDSA